MFNLLCLLPTRLLILAHVKRTNHNCVYCRLPEDEPSGSKHVEDIKNTNLKFKY
jgi:wyosine [tRNA(Phe)-imidazoG37] synthetase (radical SAM superfamily)